jgi:stearoyl-CoA desaturase (delta-9 desaturase)
MVDFSLSWLGLTSNLKRIPNFTIRKAELLMQFKRAQQQLNKKAVNYLMLMLKP